MGALTEIEIFDCLRDNFRSAAQACEDLARLPRKGPSYVKLRENLKLIEGCCRQAAYFRDGDARWLRIGLYMAECHKRAGGWLRGYRGANGQHITIAPGHLHPLFVKLAENLRNAMARAEAFRDKKTNRIGPILPVAVQGSHRDTKPVGWTPQSAGLVVQPALILPGHVTYHR